MSSHKIQLYCCPGCEHSLCPWQMSSWQKWQLGVPGSLYGSCFLSMTRAHLLQTAPQLSIEASVSMTKSGSCGRINCPLSRFVLVDHHSNLRDASLLLHQTTEKFIMPDSSGVATPSTTKVQDVPLVWLLSHLPYQSGQLAS